MFLASPTGICVEWVTCPVFSRGISFKWTAMWICFASAEHKRLRIAFASLLSILVSTVFFVCCVRQKYIKHIGRGRERLAVSLLSYFYARELHPYLSTKNNIHFFRPIILYIGFLCRTTSRWCNVDLGGWLIAVHIKYMGIKV